MFVADSGWGYYGVVQRLFDSNYRVVTWARIVIMNSESGSHPGPGWTVAENY